MSNELVADTYTDLELDGNRQIFVGGDGDLETTEGIENAIQSVAINVGDAIRDLIGQPSTPQQRARVEARVEDAIRSDVQIDSVTRVSVNDVTDNSVELEVFSTMNNSFTISVEG